MAATMAGSWTASGQDINTLGANLNSLRERH